MCHGVGTLPDCIKCTPDKVYISWHGIDPDKETMPCHGVGNLSGCISCTHGKVDISWHEIDHDNETIICHGVSTLSGCIPLTPDKVDIPWHGIDHDRGTILCHGVCTLSGCIPCTPVRVSIPWHGTDNTMKLTSGVQNNERLCGEPAPMVLLADWTMQNPEAPGCICCIHGHGCPQDQPNFHQEVFRDLSW